jgi:hypothetical protein
MALTFRIDFTTRNPFTQQRINQLVRDLEKYENKWAQDTIKKAQVYPALTPLQAAGGGYRRTFHFKYGWKIRQATRVGNGLVVGISNDMPYAGHVVGDDFGKGQAGIHKGRWYLLANLVKSTEFARGAQEIITRDLQRAMSNP